MFIFKVQKEGVDTIDLIQLRYLKGELKVVGVQLRWRLNGEKVY